MFTDFKDLDNKISQTLNNIITKPTNLNNEKLYSDVVNNILNDETDVNLKGDLESLLQSVTVSQDRTKRYALYEEMITSLSIIKRILKVYISNILYKNPIDGTSLVYRKKNESESYDSDKNVIKDIIEQFNLLHKLKHIIIPTQLKYGDAFVEIINLNSEDVANTVNKKLLLEDIQINNSNHNYILENITDLFLEDKINKNNNVDTIYNDNIIIKTHAPKNIIILETNHGTRIGYLEVNNEINSNNQNNNAVYNLIRQLSTNNNTNLSSQDDIMNQLSQKLVNNLLVKHNIKNSKEISKQLPPETYLFIKKTVIEYNVNKNNTSLNKVRFIPVTNMVHFCNTSSQFYPYGESIFDSLILPGKLYILTQLANTITKLSRSSLIRKWTIDTGSSLMQSNSLQKVKREIFNSRVTLNDLGSFKSLPKIMSDLF